MDVNSHSFYRMFSFFLSTCRIVNMHHEMKKWMVCKTIVIDTHIYHTYISDHISASP